MRLATDFSPRRPQHSLDLKTLHPDATFLRILGVNYIHISTADGGDLYATEHGVPFLRQLDPANWYEPQWFAQHRQRLPGTGTVYRIATRPVPDARVPSVELVIKWSRVGQEVPLDTLTLDRNINAEFNTPFEEFARLEELRRGEHGPRQIRILTQKPLAIYVPPERMQPWQTGRSKQKILARTTQHPGVEIDVLRSYIMLYGWVEGIDAVSAFAGGVANLNEQRTELERLTLRVDAELRAKGFVVTDHKPAHFILRTRNGLIRRRRRDGQIIYALVDYELLSRTADYEAWVLAANRHEYLLRQRDRFNARPASGFPRHLRAANVIGVDYIHGRAESTGGVLWVVGKDPELFGYFAPERWRTGQQVKLSDSGLTYYTQTKDRVHLVWRISRVGELPPGEVGDRGYLQVLLQGYNSPFEEFAMALALARQGIKTVYPRAIYMTASPGDVSGLIMDDRRFDRMRKIRSPDRGPIMPMSHDYVMIWGYWRGKDDDAAVEDRMLWTPLDIGAAVIKGIIDEPTGRRVMQHYADQLDAAGFSDLGLTPDHILISYVPSGSVKTDSDGQIDARLCNFQLMRAPPGNVRRNALNHGD